VFSSRSTRATRSLESGYEPQNYFDITRATRQDILRFGEQLVNAVQLRLRSVREGEGNQQARAWYLESVRQVIEH
jgi:hypothetical protein